MPYSRTVFKFSHWNICIHGEDHPPPHVHCKWGEKIVVIEIESLNIMHAKNTKIREIEALKALVARQQEILMVEWNDINGEVHGA